MHTLSPFNNLPEVYDSSRHPNPNISQPVIKVPTLEQMIAYETAKDIKVAPTTPQVVSRAELARLDRTRGAAPVVAEYQEAVAEYENMRVVMSEILEKVWRATQTYSNMASGASMPNFALNTFASINLPSLVAAPSIDLGWTTTRASMMAYSETMGRSW